MRHGRALLCAGLAAVATLGVTPGAGAAAKVTKVRLAGPKLVAWSEARATVVVRNGGRRKSRPTRLMAWLSRDGRVGDDDIPLAITKGWKVPALRAGASLTLRVRLAPAETEDGGEKVVVCTPSACAASKASEGDGEEPPRAQITLEPLERGGMANGWTQVTAAGGGKVSGGSSARDTSAELVVPPGALPDDMQLRLVPIERATLPGGGSAVAGYRLEPTDVEFLQPATLTFYLLAGQQFSGAVTTLTGGVGPIGVPATRGSDPVFHVPTATTRIFSSGDVLLTGGGTAAPARAAAAAASSGPRDWNVISRSISEHFGRQLARTGDVGTALEGAARAMTARVLRPQAAQARTPMQVRNAFLVLLGLERQLQLTGQTELQQALGLDAIKERLFAQSTRNFRTLLASCGKGDARQRLRNKALLLGTMRQYQLFGRDADLPADAFARILACPPIYTYDVTLDASHSAQARGGGLTMDLFDRFRNTASLSGPGKLSRSGLIVGPVSTQGAQWQAYRYFFAPGNGATCTGHLDPTTTTVRIAPTLRYGLTGSGAPTVVAEIDTGIAETLGEFVTMCTLDGITTGPDHDRLAIDRWTADGLRPATVHFSVPATGGYATYDEEAPQLGGGLFLNLKASVTRRP